MTGAEFTAMGIDVGGTKIAAGLVGFPGGTVSARQVLATEKDSVAALGCVFQVAADLARRAEETGIKVGAIGLGLCEIVTADETIASQAALDWDKAEILKRLSGIAPVLIEADVRAAARAEAIFGAGRDLNCFLYVSIGTGISCSLVIDGDPFTGAHGATGTMASGPWPGLYPDDSGAAPVSLEQIASGPALRARFNARGGSATRTEDVLAAAAGGNKEAIDVAQTGATALGSSIGWLVNVLDPQCVILGGGLGLSEGLFRDTLVEAARRHIWWPGHRDVPIVSARTGANAGVIGAAVSAVLKVLPR
jgi:glucokinase